MIGAGRKGPIAALWISFFPGVAIFLTVLAVYLVGEGLDDSLNPRCEGRDADDPIGKTFGLVGNPARARERSGAASCG